MSLNRSPPGETIATGMPALESEPILSLRCRDAEWLDCPEVVDAFERPVTALPRERRDLAVTELLLADQHARRWLGAASGGRTILTCETARFGAAVAFERTQADLADWTRWDELGGDLLFEPESSGSLVDLRPRSLGMRVRRSLAALAAAVPMLTLSVAQASPPIATVVTAAPPKLPEDPAGTAAPPTTTMAPATTEAPRVADPPAPIVMPMPPPARDDSLSLAGSNLWNGLEDKSLVLIMKDGTELSGTLVAHSGKDLAVARASDGTVVAVPKLDVTGIRVRASAVASGPEAAANRTGGTRETGHKLASGGGVMLGIGSTAALAGSVMLGIYISALYISLPLLLPGLAMIGGGIGLLKASNKKKAAYEKAWGITSGRNRVMPTVNANRQGGNVGLVLRF